MLPKHAHSMGGQKTAIINRKLALEKYYKDPKICKECKKIIEVPDGVKIPQIKEKIFCNRSCAAIFNNKKREKKQKKIKLRKAKAPKFNFLLKRTKREIFDSHKNWQSARTSIRRHAAYIFDKCGKNKCCQECGYSKHYEICHIKAVKDFPDTAFIQEINHKDNLIAFCPTHHWEFDNGYLRDKVYLNTDLVDWQNFLNGKHNSG